MSAIPKYVLITPARNEAELIELTIRSVASQTIRPLKWVIVSDGLTDGIDEIVSRYAADNPWIELVRMPERRETEIRRQSDCLQGRISTGRIPAI